MKHRHGRYIHKKTQFTWIEMKRTHRTYQTLPSNSIYVENGHDEYIAYIPYIASFNPENYASDNDREREREQRDKRDNVMENEWDLYIHPNVKSNSSITTATLLNTKHPMPYSPANGANENNQCNFKSVTVTMTAWKWKWEPNRTKVIRLQILYWVINYG